MTALYCVAVSPAALSGSWYSATFASSPPVLHEARNASSAARSDADGVTDGLNDISTRRTPACRVRPADDMEAGNTPGPKNTRSESSVLPGLITLLTHAEMSWSIVPPYDPAEIVAPITAPVPPLTDVDESSTSSAPQLVAEPVIVALPVSCAAEASCW